MKNRIKDALAFTVSLILILAFGFTAIFIFGSISTTIEINEKLRKSTEKKRDYQYNLERIIMHSPTWYTLVRKDGDVLVPFPLQIDYQSICDIKIIQDVPPEKSIWLRHIGTTVELHVHSSSDLGPGAWERMDVKQKITGGSAVIN